MPGRLETLGSGPPGGNELSDLKPQAGRGLSPRQFTTPRIGPPIESKLKGRQSSLQGWIDIRVGKGAAAKDFRVNKKVCNFSGYIRRLDASGWTIRIELSEESPKAFELFLQWVQLRPSLPDLRSDKPPEEPWISNAAATWALANTLEVVEFEKYAFAQFIKSVALAPIGPWQYLETRAPTTSPITRFSNHWIAWNHHLLGQGVNEFSGLKATSLAKWITAETFDPRVYDIQHWYAYCSENLNPTCAHNWKIREALLQQPKPVVQRPAEKEWGRSFEEARQGRVRETSSTVSSVSAASIRPASPVPSASPVRPSSPMNTNPPPASQVPPNYDSDNSSCCCCCCCCCC